MEYPKYIIVLETNEHIIIKCAKCDNIIYFRRKAILSMCSVEKFIEEINWFHSCMNKNDK